MDLDIKALKFEFQFKDNYGDMIANMNLMTEQFEIKGFRVMASKYKENKTRFYIKPPSIRTRYGTWMDIFWVKNKKDWKTIEIVALEQFDKEHSDYLFNKMHKRQSKDINPGAIVEKKIDQRKEIDEEDFDLKDVKF